MPSVKLSELEESYEFVNSGGPFEHGAHICRKTGEIFWESDVLANDFELPEDLGDPEHYIAVPEKSDLDLGKRLALRFVARELPQRLDEVEGIFSRRGAYRRYKALLDRKGKLQAWYRFEAVETRAALRKWSEEVDIDLVEDDGD